jgi:hypothetical protein
MENETFRDYLSGVLSSESSLGDILKPVVQSDKHHAEGDVFTHTRMVRSRLPMAIEFIRREASKPGSIFSNLGTSYDKMEMKILKLAAWFHDIGKATATKVDGGRITAHGHESPGHYMPQIDKLSGGLRDIYDSLPREDREVLFFVIDNHMSLQQEGGFPRKLWGSIFDGEGKIRDEIKPKLLVTFIIMDRTGRIRGEDFMPHVSTFRQKQDLSKVHADKEFTAMMDPLHKSRDKHLTRLGNIERTS